jgi:pyruvate dehydrogenase E2 component (dihydrolipoamide acetyltransferase)
MAVEVFIHKMTEHMDRARIIAWRVREGEMVSQFQVLMDVETEKATVELESPAAGMIKGIRAGAEDGAEVPVGETLAYIAGPDETVPVLSPLGAAGNGAAPAKPDSAPAASVAGATEVATATEVAGATVAGEHDAVRATPIARRVAKDLEIDLARVKGSGPGGRIREEDVRAFAAALSAAKAPAGGGKPAGGKAQETAAPPAVLSPKAQVQTQPVQAAAPSSPASNAEWIDLSTTQRLTGERMLESVRSAPQLALSLSVDMTNLLWLRQTLTGSGGKAPSITAFLVKAAAAALANHPRVNAALVDGRIRAYAGANIGVAVGTENGLFVPVVRGAGAKTAGQIQAEIDHFQEKAAAGRFPPEDLENGTFTLSNLGMFGIERFNAILNPPQSAILAVGKVMKTPVGLADESIALRPLMSLTLTIDHRVMDGLHGAKFLSELKQKLETLSFLV